MGSIGSLSRRNVFGVLASSEHHSICFLAEVDKNKFKATCQATPPARCQEWTTAVLGDLERKMLVPEGTWQYWFDQIEPSQWSTDGDPRTAVREKGREQQARPCDMTLLARSNMKQRLVVFVYTMERVISLGRECWSHDGC